MSFLRKRDSLPGIGRLMKFICKKSVRRALTGIITLAISFLIVQSGSAPKKYDLELGEDSPYDITATRDVENRILTEKRAKEAAEAEPPVLKRNNRIPIEVVNETEDFLQSLEKARNSYDMRAGNSGGQDTSEEFDNTVKEILTVSSELGIPVTYEMAGYLITEVDNETFTLFRERLREVIGEGMAGDITGENIEARLSVLAAEMETPDIPQNLKAVGQMAIKSLIRPNSTVDEEMTSLRRQEIYNSMMDRKVIVKEGTRVLSVGDTVTEDKLYVLEELDLLNSREFDYVFSIGIFAVLLLLEILLIIYMKSFCKKVYENLNELVVLAIIVIITLGAARILYGYSPLLVPVFMAPMLVAILLDIKLAIMVNVVLTVAVSFITRGNFTFITMAVISGTLAPFVVSRANQRSMLSAAGLLMAAVNAIVVVCMGMIDKETVRNIASDSLVAAVNGVVSIVVTIGLLPFMESAFNIITPLKLLELANPNQPLIKRLLMEAPGTYHHSLMVGNMAEVATELIGGNPLLARVGAYYHDVGKIRRPNFFGENQMSENPHDRMTPNLSTLVITSHSGDGVEIAKKYKIPAAIRDIIKQHHGTTLVAYFYHKARKDGREDSVREEDFRYLGPKPETREAAVVMLADSVEAAVRSVPDRTLGKIEGLVRKIIRDKLEDGQLDQCELTLKDLDEIARGFMQVFSGFFHGREGYPELKKERKITEAITSMEQVELMSGNRG